jgi:hypothetical protein
MHGQQASRTVHNTENTCGGAEFPEYTSGVDIWLSIDVKRLYIGCISSLDCFWMSLSQPGGITPIGNLPVHKKKPVKAFNDGGN